ncbi:MAG: FlgD immunoglobulin-like domain containing protein, partial [bacterium]
PNPFRAATSIRFSMPQPGVATLSIHDVTGRRVRSLLDGAVAPGYRSLLWDGRDDAGHALASGVYFYRLRTPAESRTGRVQLVR